MEYINLLESVNAMFYQRWYGLHVMENRLWLLDWASKAWKKFSKVIEEEMHCWKLKYC